MKIGIVDLDTSHPSNWIPILRELGHQIVGVWDGGSIHPTGYVKKFCSEHQIETLFPSIPDMVKQVDCAIIHGCDWDTHIDKARPFVEADKGVLIDKPVAGCLKDLNQIASWVAEGARISGGSSLRFPKEIQAFLDRSEEDRGQIHTVFCGCGTDEFNYGIHAYSLLAAAMGTGAESVQSLSEGSIRRIQINWSDGRTAIVVVGQMKWMPFYTTVVTDKKGESIPIEIKGLYRSLLETALPYLSGATDEPPLPTNEWLEPERWAIAARQSWQHGNRLIRLGELNPEDRGYDGVAFAQTYRESKYPPQEKATCQTT